MVAATACGAFGSSESAVALPDAEAADTATGPDGAVSPDGAAACEPLDPSADCPVGRLRCEPGAGCEHDALTDKNNCGVCGRVCESTCVNGGCVPFKLDDKGTGSGPHRALGADATSGYWVTSDGTAWQVPLDGGGTVGLGASIAGTGSFIDVAIDGDTFFLLATGNVTRATVGGQASNVVQGISATGRGRIVMDGQRVYFTEGRDLGQVGSVRKDAAGGLTALATGQHRPGDLVVGDGGIVFVNQATAPASDGAILFAPAAQAGTALEKIPGLSQVGGLVADGGVAFYTLLDKGEIWTFDLSTFKPALVVGGLAMTEHIAVDATHLYFTGMPTPDATYGIYRVLRCGGRVTPVTTNTRGGATGIVLRDPYVYWSSAGAFYRTSK